MHGSSLKVAVRRYSGLFRRSGDVREGSREHIPTGNVRLRVEGCSAAHTHDLIEAIEAPVVLELGRICDSGVDQGATASSILRSETHEGSVSGCRHELHRLLDAHVGVIVVTTTVRFPDRRGTCVGSRPSTRGRASASSILSHL